MAAETAHMYGAVMGHIVGDALGVPVEFVPREKLAEAPVAGMLEYGTHHVPRGTWSDDSSMMLCTLESLTETQRVDLPDLMERFSRWAKVGHLWPRVWGWPHRSAGAGEVLAWDRARRLRLHRGAGQRKRLTDADSAGGPVPRDEGSGPCSGGEARGHPQCFGADTRPSLPLHRLWNFLCRSVGIA